MVKSRFYHFLFFYFLVVLKFWGPEVFSYIPRIGPQNLRTLTDVPKRGGPSRGGLVVWAAPLVGAPRKAWGDRTSAAKCMLEN